MVQRIARHKFIDENNVEYNIDVALNYTLGINYRIVVNESATGNGGVTYFNGVSIREIPIQARLFADSLEDVDKKASEIKGLGDAGKVIEFITPYKSLVSNKYFIRNINFEPASGNKETLAFSCTLVEFRQANVRTTAVNLVNASAKDAFLAVYNERIGNI